MSKAHSIIEYQSAGCLFLVGKEKDTALFLALHERTRGNICDGCAYVSNCAAYKTLSKKADPPAKPKSKDFSNALFAKKNPIFYIACKLATEAMHPKMKPNEIKPTKRQASKFRSDKGMASRFRLQAIAQRQGEDKKEGENSEQAK